MAFSAEDKKILALGIGAAVLISGIAIVLKDDEPKASKKKNFGIEVDPQCNNFTVTSEARVRDMIREEVRALGKKGPVDPFDVARNYLNKAAQFCTTYPENTRNPGEAALFIMTLNTALDIMMEENLLSEAQVLTFHQMAQVWGVSQGISPDEF